MYTTATCWEHGAVLTKHVWRFNVTNSGQFAPMYLRASSSSWEEKSESEATLQCLKQPSKERFGDNETQGWGGCVGGGQCHFHCCRNGVQRPTALCRLRERHPGTHMAGTKRAVGSQTHPRNQGCALPTKATSGTASIWQQGSSQKNKEYYFSLRSTNTPKVP